MTDPVAASLLLAGSFLILVAAIGLVRMPDVFCRMHATTKAGALGCGLTLAAGVFHFDELGVATRALATIVFILLTAPIGAHLLARASYRVGRPMWQGTLLDQYQQAEDKDSAQDS